MSLIAILKKLYFLLYAEVKSDWYKFKECYFSSLKTIGYTIIPLVVLQSSLASIYVPIVLVKMVVAPI